jgi:uncharacterized membrane protein
MFTEENLMAGIFTAAAFLSALGSGLMAGLFFVFSAFMMTALSRLGAPQGIAAMQSINVAILNPVFLIVFMGTAVLSLAAAAAAVWNWSAEGSAWLLAGSLLYLVGIIVVTMVFNVPLNDELAAVDPASGEGAATWTRYLDVWVKWNHVRSVAGLGALAAFIMALR